MEKKEFAKEVERIFSQIENPVFAQEEKAKMHGQVHRCFGMLSSKDRQEYLIEEGIKCTMYFKRIWEKRILKWLENDLDSDLKWLSEQVYSDCDHNQLEENDKVSVIEDFKEIGRWFASLKKDMLEAELALQDKGSGRFGHINRNL